MDFILNTRFFAGLVAGWVLYMLWMKKSGMGKSGG